VQVAKSAPFLILTAATWNLMGGGIDNGSDVRLRRQLTLLADLDLDVAALQECKRRAMTTLHYCTWLRNSSA
jgi:hypothetical protein